MKQTSTRIVILGAGPAGVGAASQLAQRKLAEVTILEKTNVVGGLAGSFEMAGVRVDHGSHRLHPACDAEILRDIQDLLGDDLLLRPRHGRIRLRGRWVHFPLKPFDLATSLPPGFTAGVLGDLMRKALPHREPSPAAESFASVLSQGLGRTICRDFYFPYARKMWGEDPDQLSAVQARRRIQAGSIGKILRKVLTAVPGLKPKNAGCFFYPRQGFGQITERLRQHAEAEGARFLLDAQVDGIECDDRRAMRIHFQVDGREQSIDADHLWSTIPVTVLAGLLRPKPTDAVEHAIHSIRYRSMLLVYLVLPTSRFTEYDAHYFPEANIPITRLSEPKNYAAVSEPDGRTVLCAELPCNLGEGHWQMSDSELQQLVEDALRTAGIPLSAPPTQVVVRRVPFAYPIYDRGYEDRLAQINGWLSQFDNLVSLGRQGLFAHDNTHHALAMAYAATDCLQADGSFDRTRWAGCLDDFRRHVVED